MPISPKRLPFFQHLAELRQRLVIIMITLVVGSSILYFDPFYTSILAWVLAPIKAMLPGGQLNVFGPFESFTFRFKVALFASIVVFSPIVIWQIMAFFLPALKPKERRWFVPTFAASVILFLGGAGFSYYVIMKPAFQFMFAQGGNLVKVVPAADRFLTGIGLLFVGFGIAFEVPIVVFYSIGLGLIPYSKLRESWRYVYTVLAVVAAVATPDWSPVTMGALGGALVVLYEASLALARFVFAKKIKEQRQAALVEADE
ncbi:MAG: twin-arginine translocase subunit TatC [Actinobacteria bacterium HGW-Actinobacteria-7]|jgi:sec-independent protein translocase protein TatC|nr:MAG: twin-arginine translocase subunit TatC [Actinobacteria bacterium HGW-Actinobacteria-7]